MNAHESLRTFQRAHNLAATGQHAGVVELLSGQPTEEVESSPSLALILGIAQARLGRDEEAHHWVALALQRSRERGDRAAETRALNVSGAIALESGRVNEAAACFSRALAEAEREGDHATVGRCSNNLGIIANMRGDYGRAVGSYMVALAAFQRADLRSGVAEALHNLAITYRDQGDLAKAKETADRALEVAAASGDLRLSALARGGGAEIRLLAGEPTVAERAIERVMETQRRVGNVVGEAQDLRVLAGCLAAQGNVEAAKATLLDVLERAEILGRPLLAAQAERDLAHVAHRSGRLDEARDLALSARARFLALGAVAEASKLSELLPEEEVQA
jgi:tetratricopeptide (TPR) repeat protein